MKTKVIIIGAGPSGVFSAFYLKRLGIDCIVFEKNKIGGCSRYANNIENFPFLPSINGIQLQKKLKNIIKKHRIKVIHEKVEKIDFKDCFSVITSSGRFRSDYLILATGTEPVVIDEYKDFKEDVTSFDKNFFSAKKMKIAVIGGGDIAFDYALSLADRGNRVYIIFRGIRAIDMLKKRCLKNKNINLIGPSVIKKICKNEGKYFITYVINGKTVIDIFDMVFIACGRKSFLGNIKNIDKIVKNKALRNRFFMCGDVKNGIFRQIVNCAADAVNIAMKIKEIENESCSKNKRKFYCDSLYS